MPDGSEFEFDKKTEPIGAGMIAQNGKQRSAISSVSNRRISNIKKKDNLKNAGTFKSYVTPAVVAKDIQDGLKKLVKALNVSIRLDPVLKHDANGFYKDGVIHLSAMMDNPMISVLMHELPHHIQETAPAECQKLKDFVIQEGYKGNQQAIQKAIDEKVQAYAKQGEPLTRDQAMDELVATTAEATIEKVVKQDRTLGQTILNGIKKMIQSIKGLLAEAKGVDRGYSRFMEELGNLNKAEKLWVDGLKVSTTTQSKDSKGPICN